MFVAAALSRDKNYLFGDDVLRLPSLHIMGETDAVVDVERSRALAEAFENPDVFLHPGGHYIPTAKDAKDSMRAFVKRLHSEE